MKSVEVGAEVIVNGLQKAAQYNGKRGVVICWFQELGAPPVREGAWGFAPSVQDLVPTGRFGVRLKEDAKELKIAPANLTCDQSTGCELWVWD